MKRELIYRIFSDPPILETARLILRPMRSADAEDMFEYASLPSVTRYLLWSEHSSVNYTRDYLRYIENRYAVGDFYDWAIVEKKSGKMIGTCGFTRIDAVNDVGELGYVLNPAYHKMGYATEAAGEVKRFGFEVLALHRLEARFMEGNEASVRVMERLGMSFEGYAKDAIFVKGSYRTVGTFSVIDDNEILQKT